MKKHRILLAVIILTSAFLISATINLNTLFNYANQPIPSYITKDNTEGNPITDAGATLGRVLFYDKKLSSNDQVACASCHKQEFAFGDPNGEFGAMGVNGHALKNPPRIINIRFSDEKKMFWNERAANLEQLATMPIKDHIEMGYSGTMGDENFSDLLNKLNLIPYYHELFTLAFGDPSITEDRMKKAIAQFLRSIQSFDSKYDAGRNAVASDNLPFPNFSSSENNGKLLFLTPTVFNSSGQRTGGGFNCASCHRPPEFDIDPNSKHNGGSLGGQLDTLVTRAPTLRDFFNRISGQNNSNIWDQPGFDSAQLLGHYDNFSGSAVASFAGFDPRLLQNGTFQDLQMTNQEKIYLTNFLKTLTGSDVYTNPKWSSPFDSNGNIDLGSLGIVNKHLAELKIYPNPVKDELNISGEELVGSQIELRNINGQLIKKYYSQNEVIVINVSYLESGIYFVKIQDSKGKLIYSKKIIKNH